MSIIGLNLYSVRNLCQNEADLRSTLAFIKKIGYPTVQVSGLPPFSPEAIRAALDDNGLLCCGCHEDLEPLRTQLPALIHKLKILGTNFTALGYPGDPGILAEPTLDAFIEEVEGYACRYAREGFIFGYHNHAFEFEHRGDESVLDRIYRKTSFLQAELDTYWVQRGGGNPASWIRKLAGRQLALHLKDYVWRGEEAFYAELGRGNLDWDEILTAAAEAGVERYIVEQDEPTPGRDILDSVAISYDYLSSKLGA